MGSGTKCSRVVVVVAIPSRRRRGDADTDVRDGADCDCLFYLSIMHFFKRVMKVFDVMVVCFSGECFGMPAEEMQRR